MWHVHLAVHYCSSPGAVCYGPSATVVDRHHLRVSLKGVSTGVQAEGDEAQALCEELDISVLPTVQFYKEAQSCGSTAAWLHCSRTSGKVRHGRILIPPRRVCRIASTPWTTAAVPS